MSTMRSSVRLTGCSPPARRRAAGQGDVDALGGQARVERGVVQRGLARGQRLADRVATRG
jgi:hypothetical protein